MRGWRSYLKHAFFTRKPFDLKFLSRVCTNACLMSGCKRWGFSLFFIKKMDSKPSDVQCRFFLFVRKLLLVCPKSQKTRFTSIIEFMIEFYAQFRGRGVFFFKQNFFTFKSTFFGGSILSFFYFSGVYPGAISGPSTVAAPPHITVQTGSVAGNKENLGVRTSESGNSAPNRRSKGVCPFCPRNTLKMRTLSTYNDPAQ